MQEAGFFAQKRSSPTGLALVVLAHAAVLGALVLVKGPEVFGDFTQTRVRLIPLPQDPPPEPPPPRPDEPRPAPIERMTSVPVPILRPIAGPVTPPLPPLPPTYDPPGNVIARDPPVAPPTPRVSRPQRARANLGGYFSTDDYPAAAIRVEAEGTTRFTLAIGANGRVTSCTVTGSSGNSALDAATCRILRARARYTPARDQHENPVSGQDSGSVTWRLPAE
jgi:periplasmic protein TonB